MSKNALVRIKWGLSRDQTQEVSVVRSLEAKLVNKVLFPTNPSQDQTMFPSPVTARAILSLSLTGLPPTASMVGYTTVKHSGVSVVSRTFPPCINIGRNSFAPPPDKLGAAANRETVFKRNLHEESSVHFSS